MWLLCAGQKQHRSITRMSRISCGSPPAGKSRRKSMKGKRRCGMRITGSRSTSTAFWSIRKPPTCSRRRRCLIWEARRQINGWRPFWVINMPRCVRICASTPPTLPLDGCICGKMVRENINMRRSRPIRSFRSGHAAWTGSFRQCSAPIPISMRRPETPMWSMNTGQIPNAVPTGCGREMRSRT